MKSSEQNRRRIPQTPAITFPGGHVQIVNPHLPIKGVWSDILYLEPNCELPAHVHKNTSSLLICLNGNGVIGINGKRTRLRKGVCTFIPKGSEHFVKAGLRSKLTCLSINEGIIKPGAGADIRFKNRPTDSRDALPKFIDECARMAAIFQGHIREKPGDWKIFRLKL